MQEPIAQVRYALAHFGAYDWGAIDLHTLTRVAYLSRRTETEARRDVERLNRQYREFIETARRAWGNRRAVNSSPQVGD